MEPNQAVNPSPEASGIPQGIPTGVFVPNNQIPAQTPVAPVVESTPVAQSVVVQPAPAQVAPVATPTAPTTDGSLDKMFKWLARFFAKIMGQPDPITGVAVPASATAKKTDTIIGKVRNAANQAVEKATDVAGKAVNTVNQATQQIQQVVPPQAAVPTAPVVSVEPTPIAPVTPVPEQPK